MWPPWAALDTMWGMDGTLFFPATVARSPELQLPKQRMSLLFQIRELLLCIDSENN
jgi:hypothetical protein